MSLNFLRIHKLSVWNVTVPRNDRSDSGFSRNARDDQISRSTIINLCTERGWAVYNMLRSTASLRIPTFTKTNLMRDMEESITDVVRNVVRNDDENQFVLRSGCSTRQRRTYGERAEVISTICRDKTPRWYAARERERVHSHSTSLHGSWVSPAA